MYFVYSTLVILEAIRTVESTIRCIIRGDSAITILDITQYCYIICIYIYRNILYNIIYVYSTR